MEDTTPSGPKILWHSNAPWAGTGYGAQTALFGPRLQEMLGCRVAFSSFYGLRAARLGWQAPSGRSYIVYPGGRDVYGSDVLAAHFRHWTGGERGYVILLTDPWVMSHKVIATLPVLAWTPIDHEPLIDATDSWLRKSGALPVAMSKFGERILREAGHNPLYVPHGYDGTVFKQHNRKLARRLCGIPKDAFVVGMVAANKGVPSRKNFAYAIQAFKTFQRTHPDALLYLHTNLQGDGENLVQMCNSAGIRPLTTDQHAMIIGAPPTLVAALMASFDVTLNPAAGEGFGVPLVESQACGTPCIVSDFSAMPEVAPVLAGNIAVTGTYQWTRFGSWQVIPDVEEIVTGLTTLYDEAAADRRTRRNRVRKFVKHYEADNVTAEYWPHALEEAAARIIWRGKAVIEHSS